MLLNFKTYNELIEWAKLNEPIGYFEKHHILPIFMGGDKLGAIVKLSLFNHVLAHYLLAIENKNNSKIYYGNLNAAQLCLGVKSKSSYNVKKIEIESFLSDPKKVILYEKIKLLRRGMPGSNKGKKFKFKRVWYQKETQSPKHARKGMTGEQNLIKNGFFQIINCPICNKANSYYSFACCEEHKLLYLEQLKEKRKIKRSDSLKEQYLNGKRDKEKISQKNSLAQKGKSKNNQWITNGTINKAIKKDDSIPEGFYKGRFVKGHKLSEEQKLKLKGKMGKGVYIHRDNQVKRIQENKLNDWLQKGWIKGSIDRRLYKSGRADAPRKIWINDGIKSKQINITEQVPPSWQKGRILTEEQKKDYGRKSGFMWITNGIENKTIKGEQIPEGWHKGRIIC